MSTFIKGGGVTTPFGRNEFLRSTNPYPRVESYTLAASTITEQTIDGYPGQKILQPGTAIAKITSGTEAGKVGPFQAVGTQETQTLTKAGTVSGGTFTLTFGGDETVDIAYDAVAADVAAALNDLESVQEIGGVTVTGGPLNTGAFTVTFVNGTDQPLLVADVTDLTGAGAGVTVAEGTKGVAGANDGRQLTTNLVGLNMTFLPWQTIERDVEIGVAYDSVVAVQAWCFQYDKDGLLIPLTNTVADALRSTKGLDILFK